MNAKQKISRLHTQPAYKRGATTIYVVVFTTLLLSVITVGFVRLILAEQENTIKAQLAESAYDSALAGVEDAKIALIQQHNCKGKADSDVVEGNTLNCGTINNYMKQVNLSSEECDLIPKMLGRTITNGEVRIEESTSTEAALEALQAYTCVKMGFSLPDFRSTLNATNTVRVVPLVAGDIESLSKVVVRWYSDSDGTTYNYSNVSGSSATFPSIGDSDGISIPPTISVQLIQADTVFSLDDFAFTKNSTTDRGTVFLVPSGTSGSTSFGDLFKKANDKSIKNTAEIVKCAAKNSEADEFACSATLELSTSVQHNESSVGNASTRAFGFLIISAPYNQPSTSFSVQMLDNKGNVLYFEGAQIIVDSTGRANDVFSRVEARVEMSDIYFPYPTYALQLSGTANTIEKNFYLAPNCRYVSTWTGSSAIQPCNSTGTAQ